MIDLVLALLAGLATAVSPCILPVLPILMGASVATQSVYRPLAIVGGFIVSFALAALAFSALTSAFGFSQGALRTIACLGLAFFGLGMVWPPLMKPLNALTERIARAGNIPDRPGLGEVTGGFVVGISLGLVWTPCAGPILASILALIAGSGNLGHGALLLLLYGVGAGVPMLTIAYGGQAASAKVKIATRYADRLRQIFGVLVIASAAAIFFQVDTLIAAFVAGAFSQ
ncbi:cytochrome c biogenesis CcdA family protein [Caulobacter sp.]|uniref:cytochrome c biogenesis CcdA family protein n=1 Tax=Caulobacter sp. TaxID=78 RepID=UPI003BAC1963